MDLNVKAGNTFHAEAEVVSRKKPYICQLNSSDALRYYGVPHIVATQETQEIVAAFANPVHAQFFCEHLCVMDQGQISEAELQAAWKMLLERGREKDFLVGDLERGKEDETFKRELRTIVDTHP